MNIIFFQDTLLRHCNVKGVYDLGDQRQLLEILNTYQNAVPKAKHVTYTEGKPNVKWDPVSSVQMCRDGILLRGEVTIDGDIERATVGAILYRPEVQKNISGLYLVKLVPETQEMKFKVQETRPELPGVLEQYIVETIFSK